MNERELRLLRGIRNSLNAIHKEICAVRDQEKARHQYQQIRDDRPIDSPIVRAELQIPERIERSNKADSEKNRTVQLWLAVGTWLAFIAAGIYAEIAYKQLRTMGESNNINIAALQSVQRAFVTVQSLDNFPTIQRDHSGDRLEFKFVIRLENSGTTPARGIYQMFTESKLVDEPTEEQFILGSYSAAHAIGPKAPYSFGNAVIPMKDILPNAANDVAHIKSVTTKGARFTYWGWFTYRDVFENTPVHLTEWCSIMVAMGGRPNVAGVGPKVAWNFTFETCEHHNCTDEGCPDYSNIVALNSPKR